MCLYGAIGRRSLEALIWKTIEEARKIQTPAIPEFVFHAFGVAHQPPLGVHTCH